MKIYTGLSFGEASTCGDYGGASLWKKACPPPHPVTVSTFDTRKQNEAPKVTTVNYEDRALILVTVSTFDTRRLQQ